MCRSAHGDLALFALTAIANDAGGKELARFTLDHLERVREMVEASRIDMDALMRGERQP